MRWKSLILIICLLSEVVSRCYARTIYADAAAPQGGNGQSWQSPIGGPESLYLALSVAEDGDQIWVRAGFPYFGDLAILKRNVLYGGFDGTEETPDERRLERNRTFITSGGTNMSIVTGAVIDGFILSGGRNPEGPAGLYISAPTAEIRNCHIIDNRSGGHRGVAVYVEFWVDFIARVRFENCVIARNSTYPSPLGQGSRSSPAIRAAGEVTLVNCTVSDNFVEGPPPGLGPIPEIYVEGSLIATNCILNESVEVSAPGASSITYSNVLGGWPGEGNIDETPLFVEPWDPLLPDYRLLANSPGIDSGSTTGPIADLGNRPRPVDIPGVGREGEGAFDMGAFEFQLSELPTPTPTVTQTPLPTPTLHPGTDINRDEVVDVNDLLLLILDWRKVSGP